MGIEGEVRFFAVTSDSVARFNADFARPAAALSFCGSRDFPNILAINAGSLDDPSLHNPTADIFTESAQPWDWMASGTKKFAREMVSSP